MLFFWPFSTSLHFVHYFHRHALMHVHNHSHVQLHTQSVLMRCAFIRTIARTCMRPAVCGGHASLRVSASPLICPPTHPPAGLRAGQATPLPRFLCTSVQRRQLSCSGVCSVGVRTNKTDGSVCSRRTSGLEVGRASMQAGGPMLAL